MVLKHTTGMLLTDGKVARQAAAAVGLATAEKAPFSTMLESGAMEHKPSGSKPRALLLRKSSVTNPRSLENIHVGMVTSAGLLPNTKLLNAGAPLKTPAGSPALVRPLASMLRLLRDVRFVKSATGMDDREFPVRMSVTNDLSGVKTPVGRPGAVSWHEARERYSSAP